MPDKSDGVAADSCVDTLRWLDVQNLNSHVEANDHERDTARQHRRIPPGPELLKIAAARDARCETPRILHEGECLSARDVNQNLPRSMKGHNEVLSDHSATHSVQNNFGGTMKIELFHNAGPMGFDRAG